VQSRPFHYPRAMKEREMGWLFKRAVVLAAPFVWRKYRERRRNKRAAPSASSSAGRAAR
jgi:hypothetical protein